MRGGGKVSGGWGVVVPEESLKVENRKQTSNSSSQPP